jgi:hypothetical protein
VDRLGPRPAGHRGGVADGSLNRIELTQQLMGCPPSTTRMDGMDLIVEVCIEPSQYEARF